MEREKEDVATAIRSCLLTLKNGTSLAELQKDYRSLEGRNIPYRQLGFSTLESCVQSISGVRTLRRGSDLWVEIVPSKDTAHISRLVAGQNQPKNRRRRRRPFTIAPRPRPMSRNNVRATSSTYGRAPSAANSSTRNNIPSRPQAKVPPLMRLPLQTPPANHRYAATSAARVSSPPKRTTERNIQPRQDLDYATRPTSVANPAVRSGIQRSPEIVKRSMPGPSETARIDRTIAEVPASQSSPTGLARQPPQPSMLRLSDRLVVAQQPSSGNLDPTIAKTNIKITFTNPQVSSPIDPPTATSELSSQDPRDELRRIARKLGYADPAYTTIFATNKNDPNLYGVVKIGNTKKFTSYPHETQKPEAALMLAIEKALVELRAELGSNERLARTLDMNLMKKRLLEIVDRPAGIFVHKISALYRQRYNEILPDDWTDVINDWSEVRFETGADDSQILSRAAPAASRNEILPSDPTGEMIRPREFKLEERTDDSQIIRRADPAASKPLLKPIRRIEPAHLELPDKKFWIAKVSLVVSTKEIWVYLVGENYSEKLISMTSEMERYYSKMSRSSENIEQGDYCALLDDETWHRVRVIEHDAISDEADVFFIDLGDEDTIKASRLYPLEKKFFSLPPQAIRISLHGLEHFDDCESVLATIENYLLNSSHEGVFYVVELRREIDSYGPLADVILCDTSGPDDVNINDFLMAKILRDLTPSLEGQVSPVHVSYIETNGDVYVQPNHDGLSVLSIILSKLVETGLSSEDRERCAPDRIDDTTLYLVESGESGDWYRGRFVGVAAEGEKNFRRMKMFLIDTGRTIIVEPSSVIQLEKLSELLKNYPAQAIGVRLDKIEESSFGVEKIMRLKELAPPCQLLLLKVMRSDSRTPIVELFKKMPPANALRSINNILLESESPERSIDGDGNNNNVKPRRKRIERMGSRTESDETAKALSAPKIAGVGEYFDVHVTMAANPHNFTVQPFETREELRTMMAKLQYACTISSEGSPNIESMREGALFAVQHTDFVWYRGCVMNVVNGSLAVYLVDYGDVTIVHPKKFLPLSRQFLELPYQAIKARLTGIKPPEFDWTPEDTVRFQELIVGKNFVTIVTEIDAERHLPRDTVLGLNLIDVSTNDDIYIAKVLVDEGRAVFTD